MPLPTSSEFNTRLKKGEIPAGSVIVAGKNFGCGSSREQAASCLKGPDLVIVARHFARIFLQNSINLGLRTIICPEIEAEAGDEIEVTDEKVFNRTSGKSFDIVPLPAGTPGDHRCRRADPVHAQIAAWRKGQVRYSGKV